MMRRAAFDGALAAAARAAAAALEGAGIAIPGDARPDFLGELTDAIEVVAAPRAGIPLPCTGPALIGCDCKFDCMLGPPTPAGLVGDVDFTACRHRPADGCAID